MIKAKGAAHTLLFVAVSFLLSAILHVAALVWLSRVTFEFVRLKNAKAQELKRFSLEDIKKPFAHELRPTTGPGSGSGARAGDTMGELTRETDPELIAAGRDADSRIDGASSALIDHEQEKDPSRWQARQDIIAISEDLLGDDAVSANRRLIPDIGRIAMAPDIVYPVVSTDIRPSASAGTGGGASERDIDMIPAGPRAMENRGIRNPAASVTNVTEKIDEEEREERKIAPLDNFLAASLEVYRPLFDSDNAYFRLSVRRVGEDVLPVLPKDIVFVQDSSASMAEQRLHFCRDGIVSGLGMLAKNDRFNIISFSDRPVPCFTNWVSPDKANLEKARLYASSLRSAGSTDILASLGALKELDTDEGRPCIAFVVTDGLPTTGIVESAGIIREFTRANDQKVSVYTMGTRSDANMYLLDILSYCNGGSTHVVKGGRWSIREDYTNQIQSVSRPVLSNLRIAFAGSGLEVFPSKVRHLYLDDPLVLYGRIPRNMKRVTFQALGNAGERSCDMIFDLSLNVDAIKGDKEIRTDWALQKAYHMVGELARKDDESLRAQLRELAREYRLEIPYADQL